MKEAIMSNFMELPFPVEESLNQLRINLGFAGEDVKAIMITSSLPNEGKSFISMNLWRLMAAAGSKVVLIDCDLRNSVVKAKYNLSSQDELKGVVHYLSGKADMEDVIYQTNVPNGYIIPVITNIASPAILLESRRFRMLMDACRQLFDYVIMDTPPLGSVADALNIAPLCDGNLLVVRSGEIPRRMVGDSLSLLKKTGKPLLGVVLNRVMVNSNSNSYYYKRYYRYGRYYSRYYNSYYNRYGQAYGKGYGHTRQSSNGEQKTNKR